MTRRPSLVTSPKSAACVAVTAVLLSGCGDVTSLGPDDVPAVDGSVANARNHRGRIPVRLRGEGRLLEQRFAPDFPNPSDFEGRCSQPAHFVIRFAIEARGRPFRRASGELEHCSIIDFQTGQATFIDGTLAIRGRGRGSLEGVYQGTSSGGGFEDEVVFTGGTGRFRRVRGSGVQFGACDPMAGTCSYELTGTLSRSGHRERPQEEDDSR